MPHDLEQLRKEFRKFAEVCEGQSPLYAALSRRIADDSSMLELAGSARPGQPPSNLLFGAVHFLLLRGADHELKQFYPSLCGGRPPEEAFPVFVDFCRKFLESIEPMVSTRQVQTNEVGRCGVLLPAFELVSRHFDRKPLRLIEVGASAGLNLHFDRYRYEYSNGRVAGPELPARIRTELRGDARVPIPDVMPAVADRVGIDVAPVDLDDQRSVGWIEALIWPDQIHRLQLFRSAAHIARQSRVRIVQGDGLDLLPQVVESVNPGTPTCVFHSHAIYQMPKEWRQCFEALLADLGRGRDLAHVSLEWLGDDPGPKLHLTICSNGQRQTTHLADCHHHGAWLQWKQRSTMRLTSSFCEE